MNNQTSQVQQPSNEEKGSTGTKVAIIAGVCSFVAMACVLMGMVMMPGFRNDVLRVIGQVTAQPAMAIAQVAVQPTAMPAIVQPTVQPTAMPAIVQPTVELTAANTPVIGLINAFTDVGTFKVSGVPGLVDPNVVLQAKGTDAYGNTFLNNTGLGTQMMFAEPGTLLVGPDFDPNKVKNSGGRIEYISPITQQMLGTDTFSTNTAEGAFSWATGAKMTVNVGDYTIVVDSKGRTCDNNWFVVIRGLFADGKQDSDRNTTTKFSNYVAGHTQVMWYPAGAYISEENFLQVAALSHTDGRNCGHEGASGLSVLMLDLNTGAYAVIYQANLNQPWQFIASNWFQS